MVGMSFRLVKLKTIKLIFADYPLSTLLRSKIKNLLARDLVNVCKWSDMSICRLLFQ